MKRKVMLLSTVAIVALAGCAKNTRELGTSYVSPMVYDSYTCKQLAEELQRSTRRAQELTHSVNKNAEGDSVAMGVGLVLFWPALFFISGDNPDAQEYSRIKGEYEAAEITMIKKNCGDPGKNPFAEAEKAYRESKEKEQKQYPSNRRR